MRLPEFLSTYGQAHVLEKGQHLFRQGDTDHRLSFVKSGVLKAYYLAESGSERIKSFIAEGDIIGSLSAASSQTECPFSLVALATCQLIRFDFASLQSVAERDLEFANEALGALISLALKKEQREYEFLCLSPEARYKNLHQRSPGWLDRVTQADIALYLGITPEALSRIRRRIITNAYSNRQPRE